MGTKVVGQLAYQLDFHWTNQLRPRLAGLTDEQAPSAPTVSALPIGGLLKHVTGITGIVNAKAGFGTLQR